MDSLRSNIELAMYVKEAMTNYEEIAEYFDVSYSTVSCKVKMSDKSKIERLESCSLSGCSQRFLMYMRLRRFAALVLWLLGSNTVVAVEEPSSTTSFELTIQSSFELPFEDRLKSISKRFVGRPYLRSPLGEGWGIDEDPTIRFDAFDCTTYVETVLALAISLSPSSQLNNLNRIRYVGGRVEYQARRHLPEFQWLPGLIESEIINDITTDVGQMETAYVHKSISPKIWRSQTRPIVKHFDADFIPSKTIELPYIPLDNVLNTLYRVKELAVLSIVRENRADMPIVITHQALLVPTSGGYRVRHARSHLVNKVVDEPIEDFIFRLQQYQRWKVLGLNIADVINPFESAAGEK